MSDRIKRVLCPFVAILLALPKYITFLLKLRDELNVIILVLAVRHQIPLVNQRLHLFPARFRDNLLHGETVEEHFPLLEALKLQAFGGLRVQFAQIGELFLGKAHDTVLFDVAIGA